MYNIGIEILVPIAIFFGLTVFMVNAMTAMAVEGMEKK